MNIKYLYYIVSTLYSLHLSYEQNVTRENAPNNTTFPSDPNEPQTLSNADVVILPGRIKTIVEKFEEYENDHKDKIQEELNEFSKYTDKKEQAGNLNCIKVLMANIYYPLEFDSADSYYSTVCGNNQIKPLEYLKNTIENYPYICDKNGINYIKAYNIIKARHYFNCIKDLETGKFCYETEEYKTLINESIKEKNIEKKNNSQKNPKKQDSYITSINNKCNENTYCMNMIIFGDMLANKIIQENISLEMYYKKNETYGMNLNKVDLASAENCNLEEIEKKILGIKNTIKDENAKKLIEIYENGSISKFMNKNAFIKNTRNKKYY